DRQMGETVVNGFGNRLRAGARELTVHVDRHLFTCTKDTHEVMPRARLESVGAAEGRAKIRANAGLLHCKEGPRRRVAGSGVRRLIGIVNSERIGLVRFVFPAPNDASIRGRE